MQCCRYAADCYGDVDWGNCAVQVPEQLPECPVRFIRGTLVAQDGTIWAVGERKAFTAFKSAT